MKKSIVRVLALVLMLTLVITSSAAALKLQKNDKSDNVRRLQQALTQLGYYSGTVDGSFGSGTITAEDLAAALQGAVVKDEEKDKLSWNEYLENVMKIKLIFLSDRPKYNIG